MTPPAERSAIRRLSIAALAAAGVLFGIDRMIAAWIPLPPDRLEIDGGVSLLAHGDPQILVLGSSHARTFVPWADSINARQRRVDVVVVPEEGGSFHAFDWVWRHRIEPVLDGSPHNALKTVVLVTTYWDLCPGTDAYYRKQLATHAWQIGDFVADVSREGITPENRNFLRTRFHDLFPASPLVRDRGVEGLRDRLFDRLRGIDTLRLHARNEERRAARIALRLREIETEGQTCHSPQHLDAMRDVIDRVLARRLRVVLVSFPLAAATLSPASVDGTLPSYRRLCDSLAQARGISTLDLTTSHPLVDEDFEPDMDHVTGPGSERFRDWLDRTGLTDSLLDGIGR